MSEGIKPLTNPGLAVGSAAWTFRTLKHELAELKQARASAVVVLVLGLGGGWLVATAFYGERLALMEQQVVALQSPATAAAVAAVWRPSQRLVVALAVVVVLVAALMGFLFWRGTNAGPPKPATPTVTIFEHLDARNSTVTPQVRNLFERAGWRVTVTRTEVPRHANGVWLLGGTDVERHMAEWGLETLSVRPQVDYRNDDPPNMQIIIGVYEVNKVDQRAAWEWLGKTAEQQLLSRVGGLVVIHRLQAVSLTLQAVQPFIDLPFSVYNGSVWPIALEQVFGSVTLDDNALPGPPEITQGGHTTRVESASDVGIRLRQWLSVEAKAHIEQRFASHNPADFSLSGLRLHFRLNPDGLNGQPIGGITNPWMDDSRFQVLPPPV